MAFKRAMGATVLAAGIGVTGLLGVGIGTAGAQPGPDCGRPGSQQCGHDQRDNQGPGRGDWNNRGVDQGRQDHQPFNWRGQQVTPMPAGNGAGWGFWFLGQWVPL